MQHRKILPKNTKGRDFVIGDLHGRYDLLMRFMEHINFDRSADRMFSVGDLIDRGTQNLECLSLIYEDWFFSVKANHEDLMIQYFNDEPLGVWWSPNGGSWGTRYKLDASDEAIFVRDAVKKLDDLPVMLTVEKQDGTKFHIIHAELSSITPVTDEDLDDVEKFDKIAFAESSDGPFIIWGRYIFYQLHSRNLSEHVLDRFIEQAKLHKANAMFSDKLSHIYSGHTIVQQPVRFFGQTNLDTGAYRADRDEWAGLTVTEPLTDKFWKVNGLGTMEILPVVIEWNS